MIETSQERTAPLVTAEVTTRGAKHFTADELPLLMKLEILRELACGCSHGRINSAYLHQRVTASNLSDVGLFKYFTHESWESHYWSVLDELIAGGIVSWNTDMCEFTGTLADWGIVNLYGTTVLRCMELPHFRRMLLNPMFPTA